MSSTVAPEKILKELAALWVDNAKHEGPEGGAGVLRACSLTLVVIAEASEDTQALGETIAALMPEHPARTIIVRLSGAGGRALSERVYSQCWMPFGQRRQICCEQVEITVSDAALEDLRLVVLPLAVADLPLMVWCRSARFFNMPEFWQIGDMAQKVVVDSAAAPHAMQFLERERELAAGVLVGDLAWTRLTRWREMLAQVFENQQNAARLGRIERVEVEWGGSRFTAALYLATWVAECLSALGVNHGYQLTHTAAENHLHLRLAGEGIAVELAREADRMVVTIDGEAQCSNLPQPTDYHLMREELGIVRRDAVFERTLAEAAGKADAGAKRVIGKDAGAAAEACARHIFEVIEETLARQERATLAISGGSTPKLMFPAMGKLPFRWDRMDVFFVDERMVPPADEASNYKLARDFLFTAAKVPENRIHRILGELAPDEAAKRYAAEIGEVFGLKEGELPRFDVVHRGMGPDAHTASLFPGDPLTGDEHGIAAATFAAKFHQWRVTLLPGVLKAARHTVFLAAGEDKAEPLRAVFYEPYDPRKYPAQIGNQGENVVWFLDEAAAAKL